MLIGVSRLAMNGNGVIDDRADPAFLQALFQPVTAMTAGQPELAGMITGTGGDWSRADRDTHNKLIPAMVMTRRCVGKQQAWHIP